MKIEEVKRRLLQINSVDDLKENNLTLSDYETAWNVISDIRQKGFAKTIIKNVADWFQMVGCHVENASVMCFCIRL